MSPQGEISGVPVSHRDNSGVYSAVQQITELRQTFGCVYQYQRRSPRLHINASLTLHLYVAGCGDSFLLLLLIPFLSTLLILLPPPSTFSSPLSSSFTCPFSSVLLPFLFPPSFLTPPLSAACHGVPIILSVYVSSLSLRADLLSYGGDKGAGNGGQNSSLVANEFLIRATNGAVPPV